VPFPDASISPTENTDIFNSTELSLKLKHDLVHNHNSKWAKH